jgi:hypothetical protein
MSKWAKQPMNRNTNNDDSKECKTKLLHWVTSWSPSTEFLRRDGGAHLSSMPQEQSDYTSAVNLTIPE